MANTATVNVEVPRNGHYFAEWQLADIDGLPIDLTGHTVSMDARAVAGDSSVVASATLEIIEAAEGMFSVKWDGADFDSFGNVYQISRAAYDLRDEYPDGIIQIPIRGHLLIAPEVTEAP